MNWKPITPIELSSLNVTGIGRNTQQMLLVGLAGIFVGAFTTYIILQARYTEIIRQTIALYERSPQNPETQKS